jgi:hypothetical protein
MALMGTIDSREYIGGAFVTFGRPRSDDLKTFVEANLGPKQGDVRKKFLGTVQWLRPGTIGRVKHLRGEEKLRHAKLLDFRETNDLSQLTSWPSRR